MRKWLPIVVIVLFCAIVAAALIFARPSEPRKQLVVFLPSIENPFWLDVRSGVELAAKEYADDYDIRILTTSTTEGADQVEQLRTTLDRGGVSGIVLAPTNDRAPIPTIAQFNRKGIPVVLIDTDLEKAAADKAGAKWDAFIGSDNRLGGRIAAATMIEGLSNSQSPKKVLLLKGSYVHQSAIDRAEGFIEGATGKLEVLERDGEWSRQRAAEITSSVISRDSIVGIFASNDDMALGAIAALKQSNVKAENWPIVVGFDATSDAQAAIATGLMYGSVRQQAAEMGKQGVAELVALVEGNGQPGRRTFVPVDVVTASDLKQ